MITINAEEWRRHIDHDGWYCYLIPNVKTFHLYVMISATFGTPEAAKDLLVEDGKKDFVKKILAFRDELIELTKDEK
jgi:hypothetical protein